MEAEGYKALGNRVRWHWEAVTPETQKVLKVLSSHKTITSQFYLAGGTALGLRHGHRISRDLDLFSQSNTLDVGERGRVLSELSRLSQVSIQEEKEGTLHVILFKIHLSFFHYPYPLVRPGNRWKGVLVAANEDIGLMKIAAIIGRGLARDFVDLYFICQEIPLDTL
ncbi:MAG: nucleotidyl transferase AbiEii/AbiGii toxin family protein, partial [Candidatus Tectomicrobia bacterium]|nr:nucleotidyl transferase AbiEii/AbiGii toxin family protein [Candidatus Tectomicrobia bacterium]